jgi:hypothetical protein
MVISFIQVLYPTHFGGTLVNLLSMYNRENSGNRGCKPEVIPWLSIDGGGGTSQGGDYAVSGTIGQPDTSPLMSGGDYTVVRDFWGGAITPPNLNLVYLPLVTR